MEKKKKFDDLFFAYQLKKNDKLVLKYWNIKWNIPLLNDTSFWLIF